MGLAQFELHLDSAPGLTERVDLTREAVKEPHKAELSSRDDYDRTNKDR